MAEKPRLAVCPVTLEEANAFVVAQQRTEIARKAARAKWDNSLPQATHEGDLQIGGTSIPSAVLADGRRVLTQSGVMRSLGRARQAKGRQYYKGDVNLPAFLTAQNLKPFISKDLEVTSSQIEFRTVRGTKAFGCRKARGGLFDHA